MTVSVLAQARCQTALRHLVIDDVVCALVSAGVDVVDLVLLHPSIGDDDADGIVI